MLSGEEMCNKILQKPTFRILNAVVRPESLFVRRISLECDLIKHLDVVHVGDVVDGEPGWVQLTQSKV